MLSLYNIMYLIELIVFIVILIILVIVKLSGKKRNTLKSFKVIAFILMIMFFLTYIFEKPTIENANNLQIEVNSNDKIEPPKVLYHFKDISNKTEISGNIDYSKIGTYDGDINTDIYFGKYTKKVKVSVVDTTPPEINLVGDHYITQSYTKEYEELGYSAYDNYDGDITSKVVTKKENIDDKHFVIHYDVEDSSLNKTHAERKVTIIDDIPPSIMLNGDEYMVITLNSVYEEKGAIAKDDIDGDLTDKIVIEGIVDVSKEGSYTITYKVNDNSQNEGVRKRTVVVKKNVNEGAQEKGTLEAGSIYLTFDDGPSANVTPKILDILKKKNVQATFFILNYGSDLESVIKREYSEGHTIGIHGYSHDYKQIYKSEEAYMSNLKTLQDKIKKTTGGYVATVTRFPGGSSNTISKFNPGIMSKLTKLVLKNGYTYFDWNVSSEDAAGAKSADELYNNVVGRLRKNRANVVLMHDFTSNQAILQALPRIIDYGLQNGYKFYKITPNTPMVTHPVYN